jgi:flagellar hook-associated protein 1 FlgK
MYGLTHTLDIARRAMLTHQSVLSVIGHNIANANSTGYTRQTARLEAATPQRVGGINWGDGVVLARIERRRDRFLDQRVRAELAGLGGWQTRASALGLIEETLAEPSDAGLGAGLDDFFSAWSELSSNPEDMALRAQTIARSQVLANRFQNLDGRLARMGDELEGQLAIELDAFNGILTELQSVSRKIADAGQAGATTNDLSDRRDTLLDQLAEHADIGWSERANGSLVVRVGGRAVLDGALLEPLVRADLTSEITGGAIGALIELRTDTLPGLRAGLDRLARDLVTQVNALHRAGPSGSDLFTGSGAGDIAVVAAILEDPTVLNPATTGISGENDIALAIAGLQQARVIDGLTMTPGEYWSAFVSRLGTQSGEAIFQQENAQLMATAVDARRESVKGVSLDEEMADMVTTQHAYLAASRVFDTASQMLETLLTM